MEWKPHETKRGGVCLGRCLATPLPTSSTILPSIMTVDVRNGSRNEGNPAFPSTNHHKERRKKKKKNRARHTFQTCQKGQKVHDARNPKVDTPFRHDSSSWRRRRWRKTSVVVIDNHKENDGDGKVRSFRSLLGGFCKIIVGSTSSSRRRM